MGRPTGRMAGLTGRSEDEVVELQPTGVAGREKGGSGMDSQIEWIQTRRRKRKLADEASLRRHSEEKRGKEEERRGREKRKRKRGGNRIQKAGSSTSDGKVESVCSALRQSGLVLFLRLFQGNRWIVFSFSFLFLLVPRKLSRSGSTSLPDNNPKWWPHHGRLARNWILDGYSRSLQLQNNNVWKLASVPGVF